MINGASAHHPIVIGDKDTSTSSITFMTQQEEKIECRAAHIRRLSTHNDDDTESDGHFLRSHSNSNSNPNSNSNSHHSRRHKHSSTKKHKKTYDTIFTMCIQREPCNYSSPLYQKHSETLTKYFKETDVPALQKPRNSTA
eukprot:266617_1